MSLYDVLRRKNDPLDIPGFAGGTLRQQLDRTPRIAFGANGLTGLEKPEQPPAGVRFPEITPTTAPTERNPYEGYTPSAPSAPPINVKLGPNLEGLSPLERQMAVLGSEQRAAQDFPSSRV